jgi:hypothetical protein
LYIRQHFGNPPTFLKSANILGVRQYFLKPRVFKGI